MAHQRTLIRRAVAARLRAALGDDHVFPSRRDPLKLKAGQLPAACVYTLRDEVDHDSVDTAPRLLVRTCELVVQAWCAPGENPDDATDDLCATIEAALQADPQLTDPTLGALCGDLVLDETLLDQFDAGDRWLGYLEMKFLVTYRTLAVEPPANLADFLTADTRYRPPTMIEATQEEDLQAVRA